MTGHHVSRSELAHGADHQLVVSAAVQDEAGSTFEGRFATPTALEAFLDLVLHYRGRITTVRMFLKPEGYQPAEPLLEWLPSSLYFDVDQASGLGAAGLLAFDSAGASHQWLTQGTGAGHAGLALVQDPFNPSNVFPDESFVTAPELRQAVIEWAFGDVLPPPAVSWRTATEQEVKWPVGAGY